MFGSSFFLSNRRPIHRESSLMPTAFTHAFIALAGGKACFARPMPWKFWGLAMACSAGPDLDAGLHAYGVQYEDLWGHRGMMHSLLFALIVAVIIVSWAFRRERLGWANDGGCCWRFSSPSPHHMACSMHSPTADWASRSSRPSTTRDTSSPGRPSRSRH